MPMFEPYPYDQVACPWCQTTAGRFACPEHSPYRTITTPPNVYGWICPKCGNANAPQNDRCVVCPTTITTTTTTAPDNTWQTDRFIIGTVVDGPTTTLPTGITISFERTHVPQRMEWQEPVKVEMAELIPSLRCTTQSKANS